MKDQTIIEIWRDIINFKNLYQVSNLGRIRSLDRVVLRGNIKQSLTGKILSPGINTWGYNIVALCKNGKCHTRKVHRLVALTFIPNLDLKPEINHIDGNKRNNQIRNLEWVNGSENQKHAFRIGLKNHNGIYNPKAKLKFEDVKEIKKLYQKGEISQRAIAKQFEVSQGTIWNVLNNITYK